MASRLDLQKSFEKILGSRNVYFQPPSNVKMKYPAIVYSRKRIQNDHADNSAYKQMICYEGVVIDPNPDSQIIFNVLKLPYSSHDRHYVSDNLNHDAFNIYI